jgi:uncharacterized protein YbgA (DUF1722 family)/uncharacterized protein YbbK (DUF523 family)
VSGEAPLRLGISACLLGHAVRHDGGHKRDPFLTELLGPFVEWVPVCPEVELGMGVPRPSIRLERGQSSLRLVDPRTGDDHAGPMRAFAAERVAHLETLELSGYVLKKDSPSCGMERVRVWSRIPDRPPDRDGRGLFAAVLMQRLPLLPVEEEGRLNDPVLRDNFITRVFSYRRLTALREHGPAPADVVAFHAAHKYLLLSHSPAHAARLGRLVASPPRRDRARWLEEYGAAFMRTLAVRATRARHVNVLQHIAGFFKRQLDAADKRELAGLIGDYARGLVPLIVPITLVNHHVSRFDVPYVADQVYLHPHPKELMLRNHV